MAKTIALGFSQPTTAYGYGQWLWPKATNASAETKPNIINKKTTNNNGFRLWPTHNGNKNKQKRGQEAKNL
jgi:hypothetical protein